ncbi:MAG TPA: hypothetical protein VKR53_13810 [Puia sp.]|nr:hypothetical protein [Puia sp.]
MAWHFKWGRFFLLVVFMLSDHCLLSAQDYHAVQGSSLAGSLGVSNNPASMANTPFKWDIDIFSLQFKDASNLYTIADYSLLSPPRNSKYFFNAGEYKRFSDVNVNMHVLNTRIALNQKQTIAFGINLLGYGRLLSGTYNYIDTLHNVHDFFNINDPNGILHGNFTGSSWIEIFGSYSQTMYDDGDNRLNGGLTVKVTRGVAGGFTEIQNGTFTTAVINNNPPVYTLHSANARYGYSDNFDDWQKNHSLTQNLSALVNNARGGISGDIGFEYLIRQETLNDYYQKDEHKYDYDWKIGVSLLNLGYNQYILGTQSRLISHLQDVADTVLDKKFNGVKSLGAINDSISTFASSSLLAGKKIKIFGPSRIVINADRFLGNDFYLNAELSLNLNQQPAGYSHFYTQSLNLLTITPRWETKKWGLYFPLQYNIENQFWIGGACKAGPLLIGIHNWANVFAKRSLQNGGGYLALVIRSKESTKGKTDKRLDCPKY